MNVLAQTSQAILDAIDHGDLEGLPALLHAREQLLTSLTEENVTAESVAAYELGEKALAALGCLKQQLVAEHARLDQLRRGFGESEQTPHIQMVG